MLWAAFLKVATKTRDKPQTAIPCRAATERRHLRGANRRRDIPSKGNKHLRATLIKGNHLAMVAYHKEGPSKEDPVARTEVALPCNLGVMLPILSNKVGLPNNAVPCNPNMEEVTHLSNKGATPPAKVARQVKVHREEIPMVLKAPPSRGNALLNKGKDNALLNKGKDNALLNKGKGNALLSKGKSPDDLILFRIPGSWGVTS